MFDLDAGVHLDEVEIARGVDDELDRAGVGVVGGADQPDGRVAHRRAGCGIEPRGGALLDQFLVPPLHRAIALPQVDDVAVVVGDHLDLDVAGMLDVFFEIDVAVAERGLGLGLGLLEGGLQRQIVQGDAHAAPAAAGRRLDQHRKTQLVGQRHGLRLALDQSLAAGHGGDVDFLGQFSGGVLVAHQGHRLVRRPDELDLATAANLGEMRRSRPENRSPDESPARCRSRRR